MKTKARKDSIRKRRNFEEKYSWDPMSNADRERRSHKNRALIAIGIVLAFFTIYISELCSVNWCCVSGYCNVREISRISDWNSQVSTAS